MYVYGLLHRHTAIDWHIQALLEFGLYKFNSYLKRAFAYTPFYKIAHLIEFQLDSNGLLSVIPWLKIAYMGDAQRLLRTTCILNRLKICRHMRRMAREAIAEPSRRDNKH